MLNFLIFYGAITYLIGLGLIFDDRDLGPLESAILWIFSPLLVPIGIGALINKKLNQ